MAVLKLEPKNIFLYYMKGRGAGSWLLHRFLRKSWFETQSDNSTKMRVLSCFGTEGGRGHNILDFFSFSKGSFFAKFSQVLGLGSAVLIPLCLRKDYRLQPFGLSSTVQVQKMLR
jgi:hypothetical protein